MKTKSLTTFTILTVLTLLAAVCVGCKDKNSVEYIKGHSFISERGNSMVMLTFKRDMSVVYTYKNSWEKDKHYRKDLYYTLDTDTKFTILTTDTDSVWCLGQYHHTPKPYIIIDNFLLDTLYIK